MARGKEKAIDKQKITSGFFTALTGKKKKICMKRAVKFQHFSLIENYSAKLDKMGKGTVTSGEGKRKIIYKAKKRKNSSNLVQLE